MGLGVIASIALRGLRHAIETAWWALIIQFGSLPLGGTFG
jgi:hypothetical protein